MSLTKNASRFINLVKIDNELRKSAGDDVLNTLLPILGLGGAGVLAYTQRDHIVDLFNSLKAKLGLGGAAGTGSAGLDLPGDISKLLGANMGSKPGVSTQRKTKEPPRMRQGDLAQNVIDKLQATIKDRAASGEDVSALMEELSSWLAKSEPVNKATDAFNRTRPSLIMPDYSRYHNRI